MSTLTENHIKFNNTQNHASKIGIRGRLLIGFAAITLIFVIASAITFSIVVSTRNFANEVIDISLPSYDKLLDLNGRIYEAQTEIRGWLLTRNEHYKNQYNATWNNIARIIQSLDNLSAQWSSKENIATWTEIKKSIVELKEKQSQLFALPAQANTAQVQTVVNNLQNSTDKVLTQIDGPINTLGERSGGLFEIEYNQLKNGTQSIIHDMNLIQISNILLNVFGIIAAIIIAMLTSRSILKHINIFRQYSNRIAAGDLRQHLDIETSDEIGQLGHDLNTMTESLAQITKQIIQASHNMVTTLEEVKQAVDVQSAGATEQASSINEITASIEEIEKSSTQTRDKAKNLGEVAERTREKGQQGLDAVEQSINGMKVVRDKVQTIAQTILDLSNQTQQVGEITSVVNNLAQQSKMLALNASIEAAKAGEAGKGFAVVASEVKNLAEQSEHSTSQVQKILEDIRHATEKAVMVTEEGTKGVDAGTSLVEQTGEIVRSLSDVIHETTIASQQIEAAVRQETVGIEQITMGMNEINQVTSSFVASANQTMEAIKNLSQIASTLKEHVDTYKT